MKSLSAKFNLIALKTFAAYLLLSLLLLLGCAHAAPVESIPEIPEEVAILLGGVKTEVRWSDGDSFKFKEGPYKGSGVRMTGFNTLESYGPVHRWGDWTAAELYGIAKTSRNLAAQQVWECTTDGSKDGYGRVLVSCPVAAQALVAAGHAHVMAIDEEPDEILLRAQRRAQKKKVGIWAKGVPDVIVTSLHSAAEDPDSQAYNRIVDAKTGTSRVREHADTYEVCQEVCEGGSERGACLTYVPFEIRYRNKPDCLR